MELTWLQLTAGEKDRALKAWQDGLEMEEFFSARGTKKAPYRQLVALRKALHQCGPWARRFVHFDDVLKRKLVNAGSAKRWDKREAAFSQFEQMVADAVAGIAEEAGRKTEWRYHELAAELRNIWVERRGSAAPGQRPSSAAGLKANALVRLVATAFVACDIDRIGAIKASAQRTATAENKAWSVLRALPKLDNEARQ